MKKVFGLIGYPLSHSFSKKYFDEKFEREKITDNEFHLFPIESINLLPQLIQSTANLMGLAVTIPYKKQVIRFLNETSNTVQLIEACNCISIKKGKLIGYNTDVIGFEQSFIKQLQSNHTHALVLGTGGAAAAVIFVLQKLGISYQSVSRTKKNYAIQYKDLSKEIIKKYTVIINCTPLGTFPNTEAMPLLPYECITEKHYLFDLIYNPAETKFLTLGKARGAAIQNGLEMLEIQAEENWKIWND